MIRYILHSAIDMQRWDDCIRKSVNRRVYAFSWYLDLVCPEWDALVEDDYCCIFPLTHHRKWGISYVYQPYFAQQLGLFSQSPVTGATVDRFIRAIPRKFKLVEIQLNSMNRVETGGVESVIRINHELKLSLEYDGLSVQYAQNTRRNIRKAKGLQVVTGRNVSVDQLIDLFRENFGRTEGKLQAGHYQTLHSLLNYCMGQGFGYILGAYDRNGSLSAAAFFLFDSSRAYFLFAASSKQARENGAMFLLIDHFLLENAGKYEILDFEGGNDPDLGRFYKSFGAGEVSYPALSLNRLPKAMNSVFYFMRKLRQ